MPRIDKIESWSTFKYFEAENLEEAIELAKADKAANWQYSEDDSVDYFFGDSDA